jgi:hypothetical protein
MKVKCARLVLVMVWAEVDEEDVPWDLPYLLSLVRDDSNF